MQPLLRTGQNALSALETSAPPAIVQEDRSHSEAKCNQRRRHITFVSVRCKEMPRFPCNIQDYCIYLSELISYCVVRSISLHVPPLESG